MNYEDETQNTNDRIEKKLLKLVPVFKHRKRKTDQVEYEGKLKESSLKEGTRPVFVEIYRLTYPLANSA